MDNATGEPTPAPERGTLPIQEQLQTLQDIVARLGSRVITESSLRAQEERALAKQRESDREVIHKLTESVGRLVTHMDMAQRSEPMTPTPAPRAAQTVTQPEEWYNIYATPTGARVKPSSREPAVVPREEGPFKINDEAEEGVKPSTLKAPFPKMDIRDIDMFFIEAEWWFRQYNIKNHSHMIAYTSQYLEGSARDWWKSKLRADREQQGMLFHDWDHFTKRLKEQYGQKDSRVEAFNEIQRLKMPNDFPGTATKYVERFRDLNSRANIEDQGLSTHLFRTGLTRSILEKFERNPPTSLWGWYQEVEAIDHQRGVNQQSSRNEGLERAIGRRLPVTGGLSMQPKPNPTSTNPTPQRPLPPHLAQKLPARGTQGPSAMGNDTCHICKRPGHWAFHCPEKVTPAGIRPSGPRPGVHAITSDEGADHEAEELDHEQEEAENLDLEAILHEEAEVPHDQEMGNDTPVLELVGRVQGQPARILADTGAGLSIIASSFVSKHHITTKPTKKRSVHGVTGHQLYIDQTADVQVEVDGQALGKLEAHVAEAVDYDLILGYGQLQRLKPSIDWEEGRVVFGETPSVASASLENLAPDISNSTRLRESAVTDTRAGALCGGAAKCIAAFHGHEFVTATELLKAALRDGPIGFMLLDVAPASLPAFGFVPTGPDKGVEMEVEEEEKPRAVVPEAYLDLQEVFNEVEADKLPPRTEHDLKIELEPGSKPPQGPLYLKGPKEMEELRQYLEESLAKGFIRPSKSPARSPVLFVPKKDGGLRLCVDYRGLNEVTIKNRAPLPLIEEQLFLLRNAKVYTKLDLKAAYNLVRIAEGDEWKTAFGTQLGLYEYLVMPFGLANAPSHFQSLINSIYRDIIGVYVVVYLDDFLIFSNTIEEHIEQVREVLRRLKANRLFAKLSKCSFHTDQVEFLGYVITPGGVKMDEEKVRTIKEWPMPSSIHDIQRFLGFANFYRRFISHFARIARPLTSLVKPTERFKKFELPEEAKEAFHKLIAAFTSAGVLRHFDYHLPSRLETDASDFAIAGVLKQEHEKRWHPVAFYSRKMTPAERNYEIHDKELLAVVACLSQWRHMLAGLPQQLTILTDHEALKYFKSQRRINGRQARWAVLLADYDFVLQYRPGDKAGEPDALTRRQDMQPEGAEKEHNVQQVLGEKVFQESNRPSSSSPPLRESSGPVLRSRSMPTSKTCIAGLTGSHSPREGEMGGVPIHMLSRQTPRTMEEIVRGGLVDLVRAFQPLDEELKELHLKNPFEEKGGLWYKEGRLVIPKVAMAGRKGNIPTIAKTWTEELSLSVEHMRFMVMAQCHDGPSAGHVGRDATLELARRHYWWPNMAAWIADYVASCPVCARYKVPRHRPYGLLQPLATPERPWGSITMDFIEGLPVSRGYDSILVVVDRLTKLAVLAPTYKTATAADTVELFQAHTVKRFGIPEHIVSDRGRQFISDIWKAYAQRQGINHSLSTAYHPQTDGQTERVNQVIEQYLRIYCNHDQDDWVSLLPMAEFVYNNTVHSSIGISPFFACYGWHPKMHPELPERAGILDPTQKEFARNNPELVNYLKEQIRRAQSRAVEQYNKKHKDMEFQVGDMVYVNTKNWRTRRPSPKLDTRFAGPYPVLERVGRRAYRLQLPANYKVHNVFHVSMLERAKDSKLLGRKELVPSPALHDEELEFEVEAIVGKRGKGRQLEYHVQWRGYPEEAASWEPVEAINAPQLIQEYERSRGGRGMH